MEKLLRGEISPLKLARTGARLQGKVALARLSRLLGCVESAGETVELMLEFSQDALGCSLVEGTLQLDVELLCQRCLEAFSSQLLVDVRLAFVASDKAVKSLPDGLEACVLVDGKVVLEALVEDELLLALPDVPLHPREVCPAGTKYEPKPTDENNPFAVLGQLKGKVN